MMEVMTLITMMVEMVMMMVMVMVRPGIAAKVHCDIAIYIYTAGSEGAAYYAVQCTPLSSYFMIQSAYCTT